MLLLRGKTVTGLKGCNISSYLLANRGRWLTNSISEAAGSIRFLRLSSWGDPGAEEPVEEAGDEGSEKAGE